MNARLVGGVLALLCLTASLAGGYAAWNSDASSGAALPVGSEVDALRERCPDDLTEGPWVSCVQDELIFLAERSGVGPTAETIAALLAVDPDRFAPYCHAIAHNVGDQLGARLPAGSLVEDAPYACYGGLWHGFLSQRGEMLSAADFAAEVENLCTDLVNDSAAAPVVVFDCVHGVGHGFGMVQDLTFREALQECSLFAGEQQRYDCATGVASALSTRALTEAGLLPFDHGAPPPADARFPGAARTCESLKDEALQRGCWERMAAFVEASGFAVSVLASECESAAAFAEACARSLGLRLGAAYTAEEAGLAETSCGVFPAELRRACIAGVLWHTAPAVKLTSGTLGICDALSVADRNWCRDTLTEYADAELGPTRDLT